MSSINAKILSFSKRKLRKRVGDGDCWDFAYNALKHAGGKLPKRLGPTSPVTYIWSSDTKSYADAIPGDILQFKEYIIRIDALGNRETFPDGSWKQYPSNYREITLGAPWHTQILKKKESDGQITIYEQNWQNSKGKTIKKVREHTFFIEPGTYKINRKRFKEIFKVNCPDPKATNINITVSIIGGTLKIYRPEPKASETASLVHSPSAQMASNLMIPKNKRIAVKNTYLV